MKLDELLAKIEELDKAATNGPWQVLCNSRRRSIHSEAADMKVASIEPWSEMQDQADGELIALSRTALPAMAKALKVAMESARLHRERIGWKTCAECDREWPCAVIQIEATEIESILAEIGE